MQFRNITVATLLTSATAMGAFATDPNMGDGAAYEEAAKVSSQYVHDGDSYPVDDQIFTNVGGEVRSEGTADMDQDSANMDQGTATPDEDDDNPMGGAADTSYDNILTAAEQGTPVSTSDDIVIGSVAYTQEMSNGYRVFVAIEDTHDIGADMIGFSAEVLEVKTLGEGLQYSATLEDLRGHVDDKT